MKLQVQQATDIVRLIGEQVALRNKGREFVGLCPFHDDSKPSMNVSPAKQIFKCFACGAGGDVFSFVMDYHKMSFPEAMKYLADRAGIQLPERTAGDSERAAKRQNLAEANATAVKYFRDQLAGAAGKTARDYLAERGVSDEMIDAFRLGYAPQGWETFVHALRKRQLHPEGFEQAHLIRKRQDGSYFDMFRHRLIFPIFDAIDRPIAFGGRKLDPEDEPKYLNSPEHPLFNKSATLFGLNLAKKPIIDQRRAVIVEGYTDVIGCHQAGFRNVVATLGTALTRQHAQELRRYCDEVVLVFDADEAGQKAADRALEVFFNEPIDVRIAVLPSGQDPADLLGQPDGPARWEAAMETASDAMAFHFARVRAAYDAVETMTGKQRIAEEYLQSLVRMGMDKIDPVRRGMVVHQVAGLLHLDSATVGDMIRRLAARQRNRPAPPRETAGTESGNEPTPAPETPGDAPIEPAFEADEADQALAAAGGPVLTDGRRRLEQLIVGCVLNDPDLMHEPMHDGRELLESIMPGDLRHEPTRRVYGTMHDRVSDGGSVNPHGLREVLDNEALLRHALDLQYEAARMCDDDADRIRNEMHIAARALVRQRAEEDYQQQKMQATVTEDGHDSIAQRLRAAVERGRTNPSAARLPRSGL